MINRIPNRRNTAENRLRRFFSRDEAAQLYNDVGLYRRLWKGVAMPTNKCLSSVCVCLVLSGLGTLLAQESAAPAAPATQDLDY